MVALVGMISPSRPFKGVFLSVEWERVVVSSDSRVRVFALCADSTCGIHHSWRGARENVFRDVYAQAM